MRALGMIEVIGLTPAIEAADSALKAANVTLITIAKAGSGILTVEITGDVGAVTAAVGAGAAAAKKVGTLRAKHVIPNVDESLVGKIIIKEIRLFEQKNKLIIPLSQSDNTVLPDSSSHIQNYHVEENETEVKELVMDHEQSETEDKGSATEDKGFATEDRGSATEDKGSATENKGSATENGTQKEEPIATYTVTDLKKKSNDTLRAILQSQGVELTGYHKSAKKQELIQLIIAQQNH